MPRILIGPALALAGMAELALPSATSGAQRPVQTDWTIVSATGTAHYVVDGSVGSGAALWTFKADILARWRQTARNANRPGWRVMWFNFKTMPLCAPGRAGAQRNSITDVVATAAGTTSSSDYLGSGSCRIAGPVPKSFYSGSGSESNVVFLESWKAGKDIVSHVEGQVAQNAAHTPACSAVHLPPFSDVTRERIARIGLSAVQKTKRGTRVVLALFRTVPVIVQEQTVGSVTEKAKLTLRLDS